MLKLNPPLSPTQVLVATQAGILRGTLHVPVALGLQEFLNTGDDLLRLTEAQLPGVSTPQPFLALLKSAVLLVIPTDHAPVLRPDPEKMVRERRVVTCLLGQGSVRGALEVPERVRTSDFLTRGPGFLDLHHATVGPETWVDPRQSGGTSLPLVLVNSRQLLGIAE